MEVGAPVWIRDTSGNEAWVSGVVVSKSEVNDSQFAICAKSEYEEEYCFRVDKESKDVVDLKLRNSEEDSMVNNLINLTHLHEPAILCCLQQRYFRSQIYTYTGPILIAVNPFKRVDCLYTAEVLEEYYNSGLLRAQGVEIGDALPPHVYAIADAAYRDMMKVVLHGYGAEKEKLRVGQVTPANQSILISGESGAGKTESTKIVLKFLTTVGQGDDEKGMVMERILQSNPILEAFGNARTLRNDNSSRFGKFIELNFNKRGILIGGSVRTYLLEKVRLPIQQSGERNFHVFYQLFAGASEKEKIRWGLSGPEDFAYVSRGGVFRLQHVDDEVEYRALRRALDTLNFDADWQRDLFDVVAGVLHLGQLRFSSFHDGEGEGSNVDLNTCGSKESSQKVCELLGLLEKDLFSTLCTRHIVVGGENFLKKLSAAQASDARDALSKAIYSKIFDWIVRTINLSIRVEPSSVRANIGVLDIFGFESFANNSFEQLCINYTNETLQQQFNQYIFKMEQQEYDRERIEWSFVEFPDNKDCLDLIEHKLNGILVMIDDECRLPKASDEKLANRMYKAFESHQRFSATIVQRRDFRFSVHHYAGSVEYSTVTFVEKNKDELPKEACNLLISSSNNLLQRVFMEIVKEAEKTSIAKGKSGKQGSAAPSSMGFQFKEQLTSLMESIYATSPHYVRCLKPNDTNEPDNFHRPRVTEQLRYGGVLEAVRVARSGFPVRLSHGEFYSRYRLVIPICVARIYKLSDNFDQLHSNLACESFVNDLFCFISSICRESVAMRPSIQRYLNFCSNFDLGEKSIQIGLSKVFLRKGSYDVLEALRSRRHSFAALSIQSTFRGFRLFQTFSALRWAARSVQRVTRGFLARLRVHKLRAIKASILLQCHIRRFILERKYKRYHAAVVALQCQWRHSITRNILLVLRQNRHVLFIQKNWRMNSNRRKFLALRRSIIVLQNRLRKGKAVRQLRQLRTEARDLGKLKQSNDLLKQEIEELKQLALEEKERLRKELAEKAQHDVMENKNAEIEVLKKRIEEQYILLESERRLKQNLEQKLEAVKESVPTACNMCVKLQRELRDRDETIDRLQQLFSRQKEPIPTTDHRDISHTKTILENENSRLRKQHVEQQVLIDRLQGQLEKERALTRAVVTNPSTIADAATKQRGRPTDVLFENSSFSSQGGLDDDSNESVTQSESLTSALVVDSIRSAEKKVDAWKTEFQHGIRVHVWELPRTSNVEAVMKLDPTRRILQFLVTNRRSFAFFQGKHDINPISVVDITLCVPGCDIRFDGQDKNLMLTLHSRDRKMFLRFASLEERNTIVSKLRSILAADKINEIEVDRNLNARKLLGESTSLVSSTSQMQRPTRRLSVRETILEGNLAGNAQGPNDVSTNIKDLLRQLGETKDQNENFKRQMLLINNELVEKDEKIAKMKLEEFTFERKLQEKESLFKQDMILRLQLGKRLEQVLLDKEEALEQLESLKIQLDNIKSFT